MEAIIYWDHDLLIFINQNLQNAFFDTILPIVRNRYIWIPLYIFIITYTLVRFSAFKASYYLLFIIGTVICTDIASGQIVKKFVKRERPCNIPSLDKQIELRVACRRSYSFPSSHATNHFGLAFILIALFGKTNRILKWGLYSWAGLISFAQIYVGIHFPLDILGGALLALIIVRLYLLFISPTLHRLEIETSES